MPGIYCSDLSALSQHTNDNYKFGPSFSAEKLASSLVKPFHEQAKKVRFLLKEKTPGTTIGKEFETSPYYISVTPIGYFQISFSQAA